jgi:hypothetical protein
MPDKEYPPVKQSTAQSDEEQKNVDIVKEYMRLAYSPKENKGRKTVEHLCHSDAYFIAPTTFPDCHSPQGPSRSTCHT